VRGSQEARSNRGRNQSSSRGARSQRRRAVARRREGRRHSSVGALREEGVGGKEKEVGGTHYFSLLPLLSDSIKCFALPPTAPAGPVDRRARTRERDRRSTSPPRSGSRRASPRAQRRSARGSDSVPSSASPRTL